MNKMDFWKIILTSFLSALLAVIGFAFLVNGQIGQLYQKIDSLEEVVERYGVEDEVEEVAESSEEDDTQLTVNLIKNGPSSLERELEQTEDLRLTNGEYSFDCGQGGNCQVYIDLTENEDHQGKDYIFTDIDDDSSNEALVILTLLSNNGGESKYLSVLEPNQGLAKSSHSIKLDLSNVANLGYLDGRIAIEGLVRSELDCCSYQEKTLYYSWDDELLNKLN